MCFSKAMCKGIENEQEGNESESSILIFSLKERAPSYSFPSASFWFVEGEIDD